MGCEVECCSFALILSGEWSEGCCDGVYARWDGERVGKVVECVVARPSPFKFAPDCAKLLLRAGRLGGGDVGEREAEAVELVEEME